MGSQPRVRRGRGQSRWARSLLVTAGTTRKANPDTNGLRLVILILVEAAEVIKAVVVLRRVRLLVFVAERRPVQCEPRLALRAAVQKSATVAAA